MAKHRLSEETYKRLEEERTRLERTILPEIADKIGAARALGDLSENGDYHAAKDEYGMLNDRKNLIISVLEDSEIAPRPSGDEVTVLSLVTILFDGDDADMAETYLIGHIEERADGIEVMSPASPIGTTLLGRRAGDRVEVTLENGAKVAVDIVSVENT